MHVESAESGRRSVCGGRVEDRYAVGQKEKTYADADLGGLGEFAGPRHGAHGLANDEAAGVDRDLHGRRQ